MVPFRAFSSSVCFLDAQICLGEAGACECATQVTVDFEDDEVIKAWGIRAIISLAADDDDELATKKLINCTSLKEMFKVLRESHETVEKGAEASAMVVDAPAAAKGVTA